MEVSYYPGCSLSGTAKEYRESAEAVCRTLGIGLNELPDWTCCGSSSAHVTDDGLAFELSARNLEIADSIGLDLVVPCALCFSRLKAGEKKMQAGEPESISDDKFRVEHLVDFIAEHVSEKELIEKRKKTLAAINPVCYYGCLITRPPKVTDALNAEDPQSMDHILQVLGANVHPWSFKTDCCGGSLSLTLATAAHRLCQRLLNMAIEAGADCIAVACPMCHNNLDSGQKEIQKEAGQRYDLPVFYFTELMGLAFGDDSVDKWLKRHAIDPRPFLKERNLL